MTRIRRSALLFVCILAGWWAAAPRAQASEAFAAWLDDFRIEALAAGIDAATFARAFDGVGVSDKVVALDRRQPEFAITFWRYMDSRVTETRVERGRALLARHAALLREVSARYGVPASVIVALRGLESNYGENTGDFPAVEALATLAYEGRRGDFFAAELLALLALMQAGDVAFDARSSWAGALGQVQFMPSNYRTHAIDFDADGRRDLWRSEADALASAAHFLSAIGWTPGLPWGLEVRLPEGFDYGLTDLGTRLEVAQWRARGVERGDGGALPELPGPASVLVPAGAGRGPALLVSPNFGAIMNWNRSIFYAISVGHLADRIEGAGPFAAPRGADEPRLSRFEVMDMQRRLVALGFDTGGVDGMVGARTRAAIRAFQRARDLPADGYPSAELLRRLRDGTES
jgi:membrane-bound lytic murein transglycosylase B